MTRAVPPHSLDPAWPQPLRQLSVGATRAGRAPCLELNLVAPECLAGGSGGAVRRVARH